MKKPPAHAKLNQIGKERNAEMLSPTLVVMAAGAGSRFGGLKQLKAVDDAGHPIIDFSLYDARRAGFEHVVFIIKRAIEEEFKSAVGRRMERVFHVDYVFQEPDVLPEGYAPPEGRTKPWGTGHAVACCRGVLDGSPFAVINADDFYGPGAFRALYDFLAVPRPETEQAMVGYTLRNTVTEHGSVSRGVCAVEGGRLVGITERLRIEKRGDAAVDLTDGTALTGDETVSMNLWGFSVRMLEELWARFPAFLDDAARTDPLKREYFLPEVVGAALREGKCTVDALPCDEKWYGVTYPEDLQSVRDAVAAMKRTGRYPEKLWE